MSEERKVHIRINRWDFIALCEERTVYPGIVLNDERLVITWSRETPTRDYQRFKKYLETEY